VSSSSLLLGLSSLFGTLVSLALEGALLVLALTTIRRHRPEASLFLAASAGVTLFVSLTASVAYPLLARLFSTDDYVKATALAGLFFTLLRGAAGVLLLVGLVRLATPSPSEDPTRYQ
jgi:hypothetical protein